MQELRSKVPGWMSAVVVVGVLLMAHSELVGGEAHSEFSEDESSDEKEEEGVLGATELVGDWVGVSCAEVW